MLPYIDDFFLMLKVKGYSEETIYNYKRDLDVFGKFLESHSFLFDEIHLEELAQYKTYLFSEHRKTFKATKFKERLSGRSVNRMLSALRSYLKYLVKIDYKIPLAPEAVELTRTEKKHPQVPELDDLVLLIEAPTKLEKKRNNCFKKSSYFRAYFCDGNANF